MVLSLLRRSSRGKVGYLSLFMLVFFTFSNFALEIVDAQIHRIDSPELYDTLSAEVLSPPTRYTTSAPDRQRSSSLGTAAISSVTEALSPILPFTGGMDLRREELWDTSNGWFNTAGSMIDQVRDAFGLEPMMQPSSSWTMIPRGGAKAASTGIKVNSVPPKRKPQPHVSTLSATTPFVSVDTISQMTLGDLTAAVQFAVESTRPGFNEKKFLDSIEPRMKPTILSMKNAASKSRGIDVEPALTRAPSTKYPVDFGDFDALQFCGAMRLFAEWRVVRQVPDGYKGFAVGMNLGQKDIVQNVAKIEKAVHEWIEYRRDILTLQSQWDSADAQEDTCPLDIKGSQDCTLRSPTLRQLLQHELDMEAHQKLPRLKDRTGAMGLLWVRRQLHYQTELFANILHVPKKFTTTNSAVTAAYNAVYGKFHGWAVQKIFTYSFQAAPEVDVIYRYMNPHQLKLSQKKASQAKSGTVKVTKDESSNTKDSKKGKGLNPFQKFGNHVGGMWDNAMTGFGNDSVKNSDDESSSSGELDDSEVEERVTSEMTEDAHKHIMLYLEIVQPVLGDILRLFDEMNMDDPTKV